MRDPHLNVIKEPYQKSLQFDSFGRSYMQGKKNNRMLKNPSLEESQSSAKKQNVLTVTNTCKYWK